MESVDKISVSELIQRVNLRNLTPEVNTDEKFITIPDVNRPAMQLTGFFHHFDSERVQIIGNVETAYLKTLERADRRARYAELTKYNMPCVIYAVRKMAVLICKSLGIYLIRSMSSMCLWWGMCNYSKKQKD